MIRKRTLFIVGAGASREYGFPLGGALLTSIAGMLHPERPDPELMGILREKYANSWPQVEEACSAIRDSSKRFLSIDELLHFHKDVPLVVEIGKLAIARSILAAEHTSTDSLPTSDSPNWLDQFLTLAIAGRTRAEMDAAFEHVSIICFNYDRSIEHLLFGELQKSARLTSQQAADVVNKIKILRPYGRVAPLPWQTKGFRVPFGNTRTTALDEIAKGIRTFTEATTSDTDELMQREMAEAANIIVLGFGFHSQNMRLLQANAHSKGRKRVIATSLGIDELNRPALEARIKELIPMYGHYESEVILVDDTAGNTMRRLFPTISSLVS